MCRFRAVNYGLQPLSPGNFYYTFECFLSAVRAWFFGQYSKSPVKTILAGPICQMAATAQQAALVFGRILTWLTCHITLSFHKKPSSKEMSSLAES